MACGGWHARLARIVGFVCERSGGAVAARTVAVLTIVGGGGGGGLRRVVSAAQVFTRSVGVTRRVVGLAARLHVRNVVVSASPRTRCCDNRRSV